MRVIVKVYDKKEDGPRFVFHTAFEHENEREGAAAELPPRKSIEVRAIAFFDPPPLRGEAEEASVARASAQTEHSGFSGQ